MNWMTLRMAAVPSFRDLHEESRPQAGSSLRRLSLELLEPALAAGGATADFGAVLAELADAHLFTEERHSAEQRLLAAREHPTDPGPDDRPSQRFTVGLDDQQGTVLWLPDDADDARQDVQVFAGPEGGPVARLRMTGELGPEHARVTAVQRLEAAACADGPCVEWMARCGGDGCACHKFRVRGEQVRRRLLVTGGGRKGIAILQCDLD
jgi:hypothetical protein